MVGTEWFYLAAVSACVVLLSCGLNAVAEPDAGDPVEVLTGFKAIR